MTSERFSVLIEILESTYQMLIHTVFEMTLITHTFQSAINSPVTMQCQSLETI